MTLFESIFAFISIVTSLALAHLIAGVVMLVRQAERQTISPIHACWVWLAFMLIIGNWAGLVGVQDDPAWPPSRILLWLIAMISLYGFTALLIPPAQAGEGINLRAFERAEGRRYTMAHNVFAGCALLLIFGVRGFDLEVLAIGAFPLLAFALGMAALFARPAWLRLIIAALLALNGSLMTFGLLAALSP